MNDDFQLLLELLSEEELYRVRHRANKKGCEHLAELLSAEIKKREAKQ